MIPEDIQTMLAGEAWEQEQDPAVQKVEKEKGQEVGAGPKQTNKTSGIYFL